MLPKTLGGVELSEEPATLRKSVGDRCRHVQTQLKLGFRKGIFEDHILRT